ncbi:MAG: cytochrome c oxidase subunit I, partial [Mastigocladus sp. ERB_26_1]
MTLKIPRNQPPGKEATIVVAGTTHHHPEAWKWYDYFTFNVDHKVIGIQYLVTAFLFYLIGGLMAVAMRAELATPDADLLDP